MTIFNINLACPQKREGRKIKPDRLLLAACFSSRSRRLARTLFFDRSAGGAHDRNRTCDLFLTKEVLYRLSYVSVMLLPRGEFMERETGIEPAPSAWKAEVLPLNYSRESGVLWRSDAPLQCKLVEGGGFEPPKA